MRTGRIILRVLAVISAVVLVGWYVINESGIQLMSGSKSGHISKQALELDAAAPTTAESPTPPPVFMSGSKSYTGVVSVEGAKLLMSGSKSAPVFDSNDVAPATAPTTAPATQPEAPVILPSSKSGRIFAPPNPSPTTQTLNHP